MTTRRWVSGACKAAGLMLILVGLSNAAMAAAGPPPLGRTPDSSVPEIDPGSVLSALTMLAGGLMVVTDRRRAK